MSSDSNKDLNAELDKELGEETNKHGLLCQVFRSRRHEGMYLYVDKEIGLLEVPESLLMRFGEAQPAMVLMLDEHKKLATIAASAVIKSIQEQGYYLQLPYNPYTEMSEMAAKNSKL